MQGCNMLTICLSPFDGKWERCGKSKYQNCADSNPYGLTIKWKKPIHLLTDWLIEWLSDWMTIFKATSPIDARREGKTKMVSLWTGSKLTDWTNVSTKWAHNFTDWITNWRSHLLTNYIPWVEMAVPYRKSPGTAESLTSKTYGFSLL